MMKTIITTIFCYLFITSIAQKKTIHFSNITNAALLNGSSQSAFGFQTINGIRIDKWRIGVGVGLDNYGIKSIPLFIDVRKSFGNKKWQPVVYADGGIDYPLPNDYFSAKTFNGQNVFDFKNKFYGEAGIGINKKITSKLEFNVTLGFSYKHLSYFEYYYISYDPYIAGTNYTQKDFYYRRLALRLGVQF